MAVRRALFDPSQSKSLYHFDTFSRRKLCLAPSKFAADGDSLVGGRGPQRLRLAPSPPLDAIDHKPPIPYHLERERERERAHEGELLLLKEDPGEAVLVHEPVCPGAIGALPKVEDEGFLSAHHLVAGDDLSAPPGGLPVAGGGPMGAPPLLLRHDAEEVPFLLRTT